MRSDRRWGMPVTRNKLFIEAAICCAHEGCERVYTGRVGLTAGWSGFGALFGGQDLSLGGYVIADIPADWRLVQLGAHGAALFCLEHVPEAEG